MQTGMFYWYDRGGPESGPMIEDGYVRTPAGVIWDAMQDFETDLDDDYGGKVRVDPDDGSFFGPGKHVFDDECGHWQDCDADGEYLMACEFIKPDDWHRGVRPWSEEFDEMIVD